MQDASLFSTSSLTFIVCKVFDDGHFDRCEVIPHCTFDFHFSKKRARLSMFSCVYWPSLCLLWKNVCRFGMNVNVCLGLPPIFWLGYFFLILNYMSSLYILEINPLSVALFAIIFFHSKSCLFILFIISFAVQKLLSLVRSHLFTFVFISINLGGGSERILLWCISNSVLPIFFSKSLIVASLIFKSLIHFEIIFVYGVRKCSNFILLHMAIQFSQHHLLKRWSFLHYIFLPPLSKIRCP